MLSAATEYELRNLTGIIYLIINKINYKRYIGQSINSFYIRYDSAFWWKNKRINNHLRYAIEKYGPHNFEIRIILSSQTIDALNYWETFYIRHFKSNDCKYGYNIREGGENGGKFNEEGRLNLSLCQRLTKEEFLEKCYKLYGDRYDYDKVIIGFHKDKIELRCKKHNHIFYKRMCDHFQGDGGCKLCANEKCRDFMSLSFDTIIMRSKVIHGDKYEYLEDIPIPKKQGEHKIKIKCTKCNHIFIINIHNHLKEEGLGGCAKCAARTRANDNRVSFIGFVHKANQKHNHEFTYKEDGYFDCFSEIEIKHKTCGTEFIQKANRHLKYVIACPKCAAIDRLNRVRSIMCLDIIGQKIQTFSSRKIAANTLDLDAKQIDFAAQNDEIYAGFRWKYCGKDYEFKNMKAKNVEHYNYYV